MDDVKYKELISVTDQMIFKEICSMLDEKQIPYLTDDDGDFLRLISGFSTFEQTIYVSEKDYEKAKEILVYYKKDYGEENLY